MINGVINIYKEKGFTSHDAVAKLRGILRQRKIGHTGTLDPDAEGVLPVCLGNATKICELLTEESKSYRAVMHLGILTDTQDMTGTVLETREVDVTAEQVTEAIESFVGTYDQIPPMYSAKKVGGKRLYDLARKGIEVERAGVPVTIHSVTIEKIELPLVTFTVACSRGTYIRTLCQDIGEKLGCGACMESLVRLHVGMFRIEEAFTLSQVEALRDAGTVEEHVIPVDQIFTEFPKIVLKPELDRYLINGNAISADAMLGSKERPAQVRMYFSDGRFAAIYKHHAGRKMYIPERMFLPEQ